MPLLKSIHLYRSYQLYSVNRSQTHRNQKQIFVIVSTLEHFKSAYKFLKRKHTFTVVFFCVRSLIVSRRPFKDSSFIYNNKRQKHNVVDTDLIIHWPSSMSIRYTNQSNDNNVGKTKTVSKLFKCSNE